MPLFQPNIETKGRVIRGAGGLVMAVAAAVVWPRSQAGGLVLAIAAAFLAFEAARGWCAARACGVKTKF